MTLRETIEQMHPTILVFVLGGIAAILGWALRQESINVSQQRQIDGMIQVADLSRRLGNLEGRLADRCAPP